MKIEFHDAVFGLLRQDKDFPYYYRSTVQFSANESVDFTLNLETTGKNVETISDENWEIILNGAHKVFASLQARECILRPILAAHHLSSGYDWLLRSGEPVIDVDDFVSRMILFGVSISADDNFYYTDQAVTLDYNVNHQFGSHYLYAATNDQIQLTDTEFRM